MGSWPPDDDLPYGVDGEWADGTIPAGQASVQRETTQERTQRLRRSGARMCGPQPITDGDLDAVEDFQAYLRNRKEHPVWTADQLRSIADMLIENGASHETVRLRLATQTGYGIGGGGKGPGDGPECPYCGAQGGGGHGGGCFNA